MAVKHCTGKRSAQTPGRHTTVARTTQPQRQPYQQVAAVQEAIHSSGSGTVSARSSLPAGEHSAPADPTSVVTAADSITSVQLSGAVLLPMMDALFIENGWDPSTTKSYIAYLTRFGSPEEIDGRFRNRFSRTLFADENDAFASELNSLSDRFSSLKTYLAGGIRYISNSNTRVLVGSCRDRCSAHQGWGAWTCSERGARAIALCPSFWPGEISQQQRGGMIVHELAHMRFGLTKHDTGTERQRGQNPECYASYVADLFGYRSFSDQCPAT